MLHDLTDWHESVVAIRNGHISGRQIGSPVTDLTLNVLKSAAFEQQSHMANYQGIVKNGHRLKSSTFFIKDETGKLVGLLCINTDYHELLEAHDKLGALIGELGLRANLPITESFNMNVRELVQANLHRVCPGYEEQVGRMSQKEKLEVIEGLSDPGDLPRQRRDRLRGGKPRRVGPDDLPLPEYDQEIDRGLLHRSGPLFRAAGYAFASM